MESTSALTKNLTFNDEFNTFHSSPDGSNGWMTAYNQWGLRTFNAEAEYYSDSSVGVSPFSINNGILDITASPTNPNSNPDQRPYTSGEINSQHSFSQLYGYFEIRAKLPAGQGLWPAFWMVPKNGSTAAELDIFEVLGNAPSVLYTSTHQVVNGVASATTLSNNVPDTSSGFHSYGVDWEPDTVTYYEDDKAIAALPTPPTMNTPMYMTINLAVGAAGSWADAPNSSTSFPATLQVDYVRAYATANTMDVSGSAAVAIPEAPTAAANTFDAGPDTLTLSLSEDAWQGDAQFTVAIDGVMIGGMHTVTASHAAGNTQIFSFAETWGAGPHTVGVSFINDAYGGSASTDRNLYVDQVAYDGQAASGVPATLLWNRTASFRTEDGSELTLHLAEDAWNGDAQYSVSIDDQIVEANGTVTASNALGQSQAVTLQTALAAGSHDVAVTFLNDAYGGTASTDRNMYVKGIDLGGTSVPNAVASFYSQGTTHFQVIVAS